MPAKLIDGRAIAEQINAETVAEIASLKEQSGVVPGLAVILVGENAASVAYVSSKDKMCARLGLHSERVNLPESTSEGELLAIVNDLNFKREVHGILVQSPLPPQISAGNILGAIDPTKDVDGLHPFNVGKLALGDPTGFSSCTPAGVHEMLIRSGVKIDGAHVVILGRSALVGRPLSLILSQKNSRANATVTVCHSGSHNLAEICRSADILVAAVGVPRFVKADMVREGAVIIDVGISRVEDQTAGKGYRLVGDVDFDAVATKAALITPVPGGVGPMTIAMLMHNTVRAAQMRLGLA